MSVGSRQNECLAADIAAEALVSANILVVAAAGNNAIDACSVHPASSKNTLTVGAVGLDDATSKDVVWSKTNYGPCVSVHAPGQSITSAGLTSPDAEKVMSGTSMAAPMVAGQSLLIMAAAPEMPVSAVREIILSSATRGTLDGSNVALSDVKIAHVPWKQMENQTAVRSPSDEFEGLHGGEPVENDVVQLDLVTTSITDPPMQYVGDFVAKNITSRILFRGREPAFSECSLSPDVDTHQAARNTNMSSEHLSISSTKLSTSESPKITDGGVRMPLHLRCQICCSKGNGKQLLRLIQEGSGHAQDAKVGDIWALTTPDGAPVSTVGRAKLVRTEGDARNESTEAIAGVSKTSWFAVTGSAIASILCLVGIILVARKVVAKSNTDLIDESRDRGFFF